MPCPVPPRLWSLDDANAALPEVRRLLDKARQELDRLHGVQGHIDDLRSLWGDRLADPACEGHDEFRTYATLFGDTRERLQAVLARFEALGVEVKDLQNGLVDFRARLADQEVYLCWREGEPRITHWHTLLGGFAGRQPVPELALPADGPDA